jgi:hypothetical protein
MFDDETQKTAHLIGGTEFEGDTLAVRLACCDRSTSKFPRVLVPIRAVLDQSELGYCVSAAVAILTRAANIHLATFFTRNALDAALPTWTSAQIGGVGAHTVEEADVVPHEVVVLGLDPNLELDWL